MSHFTTCSVNQIRNAMIQSATEAAGWDQYFGWGELNAQAAYDLLSTDGCEAGGKAPLDIPGIVSSHEVALGGVDQKTYGCISNDQCSGIPDSLNSPSTMNLCDVTNHQCYQTATCSIDEECDDGNTCNGVETCNTSINTCNPTAAVSSLIVSHCSLPDYHHE